MLEDDSQLNIENISMGDINTEKEFREPGERRPPPVPLRENTPTFQNMLADGPTRRFSRFDLMIAQSPPRTPPAPLVLEGEIADPPAPPHFESQIVTILLNLYSK